MKKTEEAIKEVEELKKKARSKWSKGVFDYVFDFFESVKNREEYEHRTVSSINELKDWILNGTTGFTMYSYYGNALTANYSIAHRLCTSSELKRTKEGERNPNSNENWLDVQARALTQAWEIIKKAYKD